MEPRWLVVGEDGVHEGTIKRRGHIVFVLVRARASFHVMLIRSHRDGFALLVR